MELRVKEICKEKGITMESLADQLGIARTNLTKTINGNPTISTLNKIASALDVELIDLFNTKKEDFTAFVSCSGKMYRFDDSESLAEWLEKKKPQTGKE
ncbi:MAG: helix-turn-helix transcriptional regulator [Bacteroidales bacterium]|jgi:transcriptional regulator with XRE-family HTH domain|nr:helix-turn-helix transcriptional regulator [Bacteroidales bacterium]